MTALPATDITRRFNGLAIETRPFIDGSYRDALADCRIDKTCPADGRRIPDLPACSPADVDAAVAAAQAACDRGDWRRLPRSEKKRVLLRLADAVESEKDTLAYLDTLETGRAYSNFTEHSIPKAVAALRWFAEAIDKQYDQLTSPSHDSMGIVTREPLGVVGVITPWNDPLVVAMWKIAPALAMGNSVVAKPAEQSSCSLLRVAALAADAGLPNGVLNVLPGLGPVAGQALARHPNVRGIFFTGSSEVGKEILRCAGESNMKKVGLECGGKSAFVVSSRCRDLGEAARTLARNMFYNQGQICSAPSRALVHHEIREEFIARLLEEIPAYWPGNPFDPSTLVGAVSGAEQYRKIDGYLARAQEAGLRPVTRHPPSLPCDSGFYVAPTVFVDPPADSELLRDEIFGPVLTIQSFDSIEAGIVMANDSRFGLAASIWSDDIDEAMTCARLLEAGIVHVNSYGEDDNSAPFGGIKESGIGRDKSVFAFDQYSVLKTTWIKLRNAR